MKKSFILALVIAIVAALWILSGFLLPADKAPGQAENSKQAEKAVMQVRVRVLQAQPFVNDVIVTGRTRASRQVSLKAETDGQVITLQAEKGTQVKEGDVIAQLEERDRKARLVEARQRVKQREIEYNAAKSLENKGFNSRVRLAQTRADLETARANLKQAEVDLDNINIRAPFDGIVYEQHIEIGDFVSVGQDVYTIVDLDPLELTGFVTEKQIVDIPKDVKAKAELIDGHIVEGTVSYVASVADQQTRTFAIEIAVPNADYKVVEGMTARIHIPVASRQAYKISPAILSLNDAGQVGLKIVNESNRVEFVTVTILADHPDHMWIAGLQDKAKVITVGQDFVVPGQTVEPVMAEGDGLL